MFSWERMQGISSSYSDIFGHFHCCHVGHREYFEEADSVYFQHIEIWPFNGCDRIGLFSFNIIKGVDC